MKKLLLLHGPGKTSSRKKLIEEKGRFDPENVVAFDSESSPKDIADNLVATSLFTDERLVILENPSEDFTNYPILTTHYQLILWFDHEVSEKKPVMEWVKKNNGQMLYFPESKEISVFPFLDYLAAGRVEAFLEIDKLKKANFDIHYLITMVFYLLRNLVITPKTAPQFVKDKLTRQRKNFDLGKITKTYKEILEIDFKIKSGLLEKSQAEFSLVSKFL